ncbi:MAG: ParB/RepB/Spo0J family partition protein [Sphaerochaetaceae bacterium]|nr:ParB/RepB/Spo0J family partition protein [Sphaerochaetaceae bacterium]MDX9809538.1 ParB/RepB/Spo0J family partition protein [Sphaerochaetaceae bacterium]
MSNSIGKKHGLGKGIGALMDDYSFEAVFPSQNGSKQQNGQSYEIMDINKVRPNPNQPRKQFDPDTLEELAESIRNQGILQPLLVERVSDDEYIIVAGERRYRAALLLGLDKVPVIIKSFSELQRLEVSLIENIQRENLNPVDEAKAYFYLLEQAEIKQEDLAQRVGKKRSTIANSIRLLQLPKMMQDSLVSGDITPGHARAILSVINPADQIVLYRKILDGNISVRTTEKLAADLNSGKRAASNKKSAKQAMKSADILAIETKFLDVLGTRVELKGNLKRGKIEISYHSMEDLERLYELLSPEDTLFGI